MDLEQYLHTFWLDTILRLKSYRYQLFLTGKNNFRYGRSITNEYKGNRKLVEKPEYLNTIRDIMIKNYKAVVINGYEADDALATLQRYYRDDSMIVSPDKDLKQVPGHYFNNNWNYNSYEYITREQAEENLYKQVIKGDMSTDNIQGIKGVGDKTVDKLFNEYKEYVKEYCQYSYISFRDYCIAFYATKFKSDNPKETIATLEAIKLFHEMFDLIYLTDIPLNDELLKINRLNKYCIHEE